jgi:hypothetical protein
MRWNDLKKFEIVGLPLYIEVMTYAEIVRCIKSLQVNQIIA